MSSELVYHVDNLFEHIFLKFQLILIDFHDFTVFFVTHTPLDQTVSCSISINYDYIYIVRKFMFTNFTDLSRLELLNWYFPCLSKKTKHWPKCFKRFPYYLKIDNFESSKRIDPFENLKNSHDFTKYSIVCLPAILRSNLFMLYL